jgi:nucleoside-diphosphate-sugar epimerase
MGLSAFVTGATGFVGMNLVRELAGNGWNVTALVRASSPLEDIADLDIELRQGDITQADSVLDAMPERPDCVFHVAASTSIWSRQNEQQTLINVDGTRNVTAAAVRRSAGRMVHTSSFVVWGFHDDEIDEDSPRLDNADWINYVRTKREAENVVRGVLARDGLDCVILNPAHILGPGDRRNWSRMIRMVNDGKLPGVPPGGGAFADVREVARAHIEAFHRGRRGHNYLLGGQDTKFIDVVRMAGEVLDRKVPRRPSPRWLLQAAARLYTLKAAIDGREPDITPEAAAMITRHLPCDSSKAQRELGYRFTPTRQLVEDTCQWMRERGMLN